jgi:hypothetical protein
VQATRREFGALAPAMIAHRELAALDRCLADERAALSLAPSAFERAAACDRLAQIFRATLHDPSELGLAGPLRECAEASYERVLASSRTPQRTAAAERLVHWLEETMGYELEAEGVARAEQRSERRRQRAKQIRARFGPLTPRPDPPQVPTTKP